MIQNPLRSLRLCYLFIILGVAPGAHAQDTLRLKLQDAEKSFLNNNLQLLAEKYNIDIAKAQVIQARLYNNPNFQFTGDINNPQQKKGFDLSNGTGEYIVGVQQLILLAGKRNKQVKLAETNSIMEEARFFDLLRTLRFSLRSNFYELYYLQRSAVAYSGQIAYLEQLNSVYEGLLGKGVVTLKDAVRVKSLFYTLKAEQASLQNQINSVNAEMQLLIGDNKAYVMPLADTIAATQALKQYALQTLIDTAYNNRFDLKLAQSNVLYNERNYSLQKAMAVPDLTLGAQFDKRGSFVEDATFFTVGIDLPFFNRNQGNIKAAKAAMAQSNTQQRQQQLTVENDVQKAYYKALSTDKVLSSFDPAFAGQYQKLLEAVTTNFLKKNIGLLEFTDFYESYKQNVLQFNQLQNEHMQAIEELQFAIGKNIINP